MKPSLHRSLTLWSGLLVTAFVCWAWWDSQHHWFVGGNGRFNLWHFGSGIAVKHTPYPGGWGYASYPIRSGFESLTPSPFFHTSEQYSAGVRLDPSHPWFENESEEFTPYHPGVWVCYIPYWLILPAVAVPWLGLLGWRARRRNKSIVIP